VRLALKVVMQNDGDFMDVIQPYRSIAVLRPVPPLYIDSISVNQCVLDENRGNNFFFLQIVQSGSVTN
jgi:hypothetical protein